MFLSLGPAIRTCDADNHQPDPELPEREHVHDRPVFMAYFLDFPQSAIPFQLRSDRHFCNHLALDNRLMVPQAVESDRFLAVDAIEGLFIDSQQPILGGTHSDEPVFPLRHGYAAAGRCCGNPQDRRHCRRNSRLQN